MKYFAVIGFFLSVTLLTAQSTVDSTDTSLVFENSLFSKKISFHKKTAHPVVVDYYRKNIGVLEKITSGTETPLFEFVVNNQRVSALDSLWVFQEHRKREMGNGGTEHQLVFEGLKEKVSGLKVVLYQQVFPNSTLVREKLELHTEKATFNLNKVDDRLHFKFPSYALMNEGDTDLKNTEIRIASWENEAITFGNPEKGNHMYYPSITTTKISEQKQTVKGPISIVNNGVISWVTAYEHASQDNLKGLLDEQKKGKGNLINDAMQGTKGVFDFPIQDEDFNFLGISNQIKGKNLNISIEILRGGYLDGEIIDKQNPYATIWTASAFYEGNDFEDGKNIVRQYLLHQICEKPASRKPEFYYNTWGLQRNDPSIPFREILTYDRVFEDIEYASEMNVDIFVLDCGWENKQGEWFANKERFPEGLKPIKKRLYAHDMKMGLWFSPMGIDSTSQRYGKNPQWVIKDSENKPIRTQWDHPGFDFVSGFFDLFVKDCRALIDEGCRFMKWDAINTFYSSLPDLRHGSSNYSEEEIRARYDYLLPIYVVKAMEILTEYEPELVIEIDLTEARRVMTGLAPLSQGKFFWMNNGASTYNDYSAFRTKSTRTIVNEYAGLIPLELFTFANYPHNIEGDMNYNVNSSLMAGHGFWGNLSLMSQNERLWVGKQIERSKKLLPYLLEVNPKIIGEVGSSPEIYEIINTNEAVGQINIFSEKPVEQALESKLNAGNTLAVLNSAYRLKNNLLQTSASIAKKEGSQVIFILPNKDQGVSLRKSTCQLTDASFKNAVLEYSTSTSGKQELWWPIEQGRPVIKNGNATFSEMTATEDFFLVHVDVKEATTIVIAEEN